MLNRLREATESLHKELEKENLANRIIDHSINEDQYYLLLYQNLLAYQAIELELKRFLPEIQFKTPSITEDLSASGKYDPEMENPLNFNCETEAEAIGAAYVVEGSSLGGMVIGKHIKECPSLTTLKEQRFFSGERENMKGWNAFLKLLRDRDFSEEEKQRAAAKAIEAFELFGKAYNITSIPEKPRVSL